MMISFFDTCVGHRERRLLDAAWVDWLRTFAWDFWCTNTWTYPVSEATALRTVRNWLAGTPEAYAAVGIQRGPLAMKLHTHVLVGGVWQPQLTETRLRRTWVKSGNVLIERYRSALGGIEYLVRQASEIEWIGDPPSAVSDKREKH